MCVCALKYTMKMWINRLLNCVKQVYKSYFVEIFDECGGVGVKMDSYEFITAHKLNDKYFDVLFTFDEIVLSKINLKKKKWIIHSEK